ncbi:MAG: low molecular weight protein-tyrosine-phosphatase, partial [Longimicrobiales bacterium]
MDNGTIGVLFVCLGNICRSPLAEGVFRALVVEEGVASRFEIDSAGTSDYHAGDTPDPRTVEVALRRGVPIDHRARQITGGDLSRFDYIMVMDAQNRDRVRRLADSVRPDTEVHMLRAFDAE